MAPKIKGDTNNWKYGAAKSSWVYPNQRNQLLTGSKRTRDCRLTSCGAAKPATPRSINAIALNAENAMTFIPRDESLRRFRVSPASQAVSFAALPPWSLVRVMRPIVAHLVS
jgi:hypothetical protein